MILATVIKRIAHTNGLVLQSQVFLTSDINHQPVDVLQYYDKVHVTNVENSWVFFPENRRDLTFKYILASTHVVTI